VPAGQQLLVNKTQIIILSACTDSFSGARVRWREAGLAVSGRMLGV
jgi:hypothetical protein